MIVDGDDQDHHTIFASLPGISRNGPVDEVNLGMYVVFNRDDTGEIGSLSSVAAFRYTAQGLTISQGYDHNYVRARFLDKELEQEDYNPELRDQELRGIENDLAIIERAQGINPPTPQQMALMLAVEA